jgi:hypothetical protein
MKKLSWLILFLTLQSSIAFCDDLDGGISSGDDSISSDLQNAPNVAFIKRNAKAKVNNGMGESNISSGGVGNVTSLCTHNCTIVNSANNKNVTNVSE